MLFTVSAFGSFWFFVLGAIVGSFLNVVIFRVPRGFSVQLPSRSMCVECKRTLEWYENIPIVSYLALRGKCAQCKTPIGLRSVLVEFFTALLFMGAYAHFGFSFFTLYYCAFIAALLAVTFIDIDFRIIPDSISIPGTVIAVLLSPWVPDLGLMNSLVGAAVGWGVFAFMGFLYERVMKREGLGFGDVKLLMFIGAALGPRGALTTVVFSSFIGSVVGIILMKLEKKDLKMAVPYGPFLALGAMIFLFWGESLQLMLNY